MNICPSGAELFRADRQADGWTHMTKLTVAFRNHFVLDIIYRLNIYYVGPSDSTFARRTMS